MLRTLAAPPRGLVSGPSGRRAVLPRALPGGPRRPRQQQQQQERQRRPQRSAAADPGDTPPTPVAKDDSKFSALQRLVAGAAAATATSAAAALASLLVGPIGAARAALEAAPAPPVMEPELLETPPEVAQLMMFVVAAYLALMGAYLWLASMIDEGEDAAAISRHHGRIKDKSGGAGAGNGNGGGADGGGGGGGARLPPGYGDMLHAHIRSVREPKRGHALIAPPAPEDGGEGAAGGVATIKAAFARQAAEYVAQQVREAGSVVRRKIYLRRLAAQDAARTVGGGGRRADAVHAAHAAHAVPALPVDLEGLLLAEPGQLEALVDRCLDGVPPEQLADDDCEASIVRSVTGVVASRLVAAEAGELVRTLAAEVRARRGPTAPTALGI